MQGVLFAERLSPGNPEIGVPADVGAFCPADAVCTKLRCSSDVVRGAQRCSALDRMTDETLRVTWHLKADTNGES
jgi:hypothetical protein